MKLILNIVLYLVLCTTTFSQSIKETINQHIVNGTYDPIEGIWQGTLEISIYFDKKLIRRGEPNNIVIHFYNEWGMIKGSTSDNPQDKIIELTKGPTLGSFTSKSIPTGLQHVKGSAKQVNEYSLTIIEEHQQIDKNGILVSAISEYNLQKTYPSSNDFTAIREKVSQNKEGEKTGGIRTGTGFAISTDGLIVTNFHIVDKANSIMVKVLYGDSHQKFEAEILHEDPINDLVILHVKDDGFKPFQTIPYKVKTTSSDVGEDVFVLGYPLTATMGYEIKLTVGIISSKTGFQGNVAQYQISAPIQPGNSGGPLFDKTGNLIGIINSKHRETENVGYAIKASYLQNIIELLPKRISSPSTVSLSTKSLPEKVKVLQNYVFLIEVNHD